MIIKHTFYQKSFRVLFLCYCFVFTTSTPAKVNLELRKIYFSKTILIFIKIFMSFYFKILLFLKQQQQFNMQYAVYNTYINFFAKMSHVKEKSQWGFLKRERNMKSKSCYSQLETWLK